jgi:cell division protein FtsB
MAGLRARRWAIYGTVVALLAIASALDPRGLRRYLALSREVERMQAENARLTRQDTQLAAEIRALRTDPAALERAVREELRYVRPGERVYVLEPERPAGGAP